VGRFLAAEAFSIGLSLDGPAELHDAYRVTKGGQPTHRQAMRGYEILRKHGVFTSIVCVAHNLNVQRPLTVYRFFRGPAAGIWVSSGRDTGAGERHRR